jgi:hypothetical protein
MAPVWGLPKFAGFVMHAVACRQSGWAQRAFVRLRHIAHQRIWLDERLRTLHQPRRVTDPELATVLAAYVNSVPMWVDLLEVHGKHVRRSRVYGRSRPSSRPS